MYRNPDDLSDQAHVSAPLTKPPKASSPTIPVHERPISSSRMECDPPCSKPALDSEISSNCGTVTATTRNPNFSESTEASSALRPTIAGEAGRAAESRILQNALEKEEKMAAEINTSNPIRSPEMNVDFKMELDSVSMEEDATEEISTIHYVRQFSVVGWLIIFLIINHPKCWSNFLSLFFICIELFFFFIALSVEGNLEILNLVENYCLFCKLYFMHFRLEVDMLFCIL